MGKTEQNIIHKKKRSSNHKYYPYSLVRQPDVLSIRHITNIIDTETKEQYESLPPIKRSAILLDTHFTDVNLHKIDMKLTIIPDTSKSNNYANSMEKLLSPAASYEKSYRHHVDYTNRSMLQLMKINHVSDENVNKVLMVNINIHSTSEIYRNIFIQSTEQKTFPIKLIKLYIYSDDKPLKTVSDIPHKTEIADKLHNLHDTENTVDAVVNNAVCALVPAEKRTVKIINFKYKNRRSSLVLRQKDDTIKLENICVTHRNPNYLKMEVQFLADSEVYDANEFKSVLFHYSGPEVNRLLTFTAAINKHMQLLLKKLQTVTKEHESNRLTSFTVAFNLDNLEDYFDLHDKFDNYHVNRRGYLQKVVPTIKDNMSLLPVSSKSSLLSILIGRQLLVFIITICKFNALCQRFVDSLVTLVGIHLRATVQNTRTPAPMLHNWHFYNVAQGHLLMHLLNSSNIITLNTMRKLHFVLILNPFANLVINITMQCPRNTMFGSLSTKPYSNSFSKSAKRVSSLTIQPVVKRDWRLEKLMTMVTKSDTMANRTMLPIMKKQMDDDQIDINSIYSVQCYTDSESISTHFCDSALFSSTKSVATVSDLLERESSAETVLHKLTDSNHDFVVTKDTINYYRIRSWNFLTSNISVTFPKIFQDQKNFIFRCYSNFSNESLISEVESAKDHYVNMVATLEFPRIFLKNVGKLLLTTVVNYLI